MKELLALAVEAAIAGGEKILEVYGTEDFNVTYKEDESPLTIADQKAHHAIMAYLEKTEFPILSEEGKSISYDKRSSWKSFWLVDPLDGTKEFIKRNGEFTVNIALITEGKAVMGVIYVPVLDQLYIGSEETGAFLIDNPKGKSLDSMLNSDFSIPKVDPNRAFTVVGSRSHMNDETLQYIEENTKGTDKYEVLSRGSSLKLCMVAEGKADLYPRFGPTMEWDTGAGHAIALASGAKVVRADNGEDLLYNKENLLNPYFIVKR